MNAASTPGINMPSTRPQSRAERRAEAERIRAEQETAAAEAPDVAEDAVEPLQAPEPKPVTTAARPPRPKGKDNNTVPTPPAPTVNLPMKARTSKRPFATQVQASTLGRLEWARRQGAILTDTVDAAINSYLDAAGVPQADESGDIIE
ncbi:hypothetical protein ACFWPK_31950 [Nocardia sp. NPDC058519]|uniref:hypothetical protein n=1 Tax=Nocardia sp. NPDC058519 TaxID=3346535 RepID=UPI003648B23A